MTEFSHTRVLQQEELNEVLGARDDIFLSEYETQAGEFTLHEGPFDHYQRSIDVNTCADGFEVTESFRYTIASPFWRGLLHFPIKKALKKRSYSGKSFWWAPPNRFDAVTSRTVSFLCVAAVVTGFLGALIGQTATFATEEFGADDRAQGILLASIRIGTLITVLVSALADRHGRKRLLIFSLWCGCALSLLSAFAPNLLALGVTQSMARGFATSISILIGIMAAESSPKGSRAYIAGLLTLTAGLGAGIPVWFLFLADLHIRGWRLLFFASLFFFPVVMWIRSNLQESERYQRHKKLSESTSETQKQHLIMSRVVFLAAVAFLLFIFVSPASQFRNEFLRDERNFSAAKITLFLVTAHTPQIIGVAIAAKLSDRKGRKPVAVIAVGLGSFFTVCAYSFSGFGMWAVAVLSGIISAGAGPSLGVYGAEMFGTGRRGQINGFLSLIAVLGSAVGLLLCGDLSERLGSFGETFTILAICPFLVVLIIIFFFPESANQELEDLNPENKAVT